MSESIAVLLFGAAIVGIQAAVMIFRGRSWGTQSVRIVGLSIIVIATIFLATSTVTAERLSAAYAVLGVAAGYLVGRVETKGEARD
jgi:peptidoglycan/LPS O-acetylase OafA/YrhL